MEAFFKQVVGFVNTAFRNGNEQNLLSKKQKKIQTSKLHLNVFENR